MLFFWTFYSKNPKTMYHGLQNKKILLINKTEKSISSVSMSVFGLKIHRKKWQVITETKCDSAPGCLYDHSQLNWLTWCMWSLSQQFLFE